MTDSLLILYIGILIIYRFAEYFVWRKVGSVKRKSRKEPSFFLIIIPFYFVVLIPLLENKFYGYIPGYISLPLGILLFIISLYFRIRGHLDLRKGFSMYVEKIENQNLVTTGIYKTIRHPLYLGTLLFMIACPTLMGSRYTWIFTILGILGTWIRIQIEEKFLIQNYPGYKEYKKNTWALIPGIY